MRRLACAPVLALLLTAAAACSADDGGDDAPRPSTSTSTTAPLVFEGDPAGPFCGVLRDARLDEAVRAPAATPAELEANYARTIELLARAAEHAPPELDTDVGLVLEGLLALDEALRAVGYRFDVLERSPEGVEVAAAVNDPAFRVAGDRIEAYRAQVCEL